MAFCNRLNPSMLVLMLAGGMAVAPQLALAQEQENPTTPGEIPNPGTYQGTTVLQQQSDQQDQQFRQQQQQQSQRQQYDNAIPRGQGAYSQSPPQPRNDQAQSKPRLSAHSFGHQSEGDLKANRLIANGDYAGAVRILRPLAAQGDVNAEYDLAVLYDGGRGVPQSDRIAASLYRRAAQKGHGPAIMNLTAILLKYARGAADLTTPYAWLLVAANRDLQVRDSAIQEMAMIARYMSSAQIAEARLVAQRWTPH